MSTTTQHAHVLILGSGPAGYTAARIKRTYYDFRAPASEETHTKWQDGWTLGLGAEFMPRVNWAQLFGFVVTQGVATAVNFVVQRSLIFKP